MKPLKTLSLICLTAGLWAQEPGPSRLHGYVGGPYKVALADFTGNKHTDILLGYRNLGIVAVYQGDGAGKFSKPILNVFADEYRKLIPNDESWSAPHIHNVHYADLNGDQRLDLVAGIAGLSTLQQGRVVIAQNLGKGQFKEVAKFRTPSQAKGVCLVDMDKDGRLDLLYTARGSGYKNDLKIGQLYIRRGLSGWKFGEAIISPAGRSAYYVETADLNNDGFPDVLIPNEHDTCVTYYLNPGDQLFKAGKPLPTRKITATRIPQKKSHAINDVRAADFNGDGNQDVLTANLGTSTLSLFLGKGDGTFKKDQLIDAGKNGAFLSVADFDSDGDQDFAITHWTEDFASIFLNQGGATFNRRTDYKTGQGNYGIAVGRLNADKHLDIVTANYRARSMSVLMGKGDGTFKQAINTVNGLRLHKGKWIAADP